MKTLCLVLDTNDYKWLTPFWESRLAGDDVVVVAPTFEGRFLAESLDIPYKSYDYIAWNLDKSEINNVSRKKASNWHKLDELRNNIPLQIIKTFNDYPLVEMHQSILLLAIQEIIQAHQFIHKVLEIEKPDSLLYGNRKNPFFCHPISFISGSNGVEREVVKSILARKSMDAYKSDDYFRGISPSPPEISLPMADVRSFNWPTDLIGPKILIFAWGDYYLEYFEHVIEELLQRKARIGIIIIGGQLTDEQKQTWQKQGICVFKKTAWVITDQDTLWSAWKAKCERAAEDLYNNKALENYFSDEYGTYYTGLVNEALCKQFMEMPSTVIELLRAELIVKEFDPDMVLNHFCIHPLETCDVLPARMFGVPTLSIDHGIHGYNDSQRNTFATEYFGVSGSSFRDAILTAVKAPASSVSVIGNLRYDKIRMKSDSSTEIKLRYSLDPGRPLCVICDSSGWSHMAEWRHSTFSTVESVLALKKYFPELQFIYRVHHGADYKAMSAFFANLGSHDIVFQISPDPPLLDILPAANFVISHYTSAVSESLLSGIPVIYLTAHGEPEPSYFGCDVIRVAGSFAELPELVAEVLSADLSRERVKQLSQPYFDIALAGNDGKASERLAGLILELASLPRSERKPGFQDWLGRIDASCHFDTKEFRKLLPNQLSESKSNRPYISVIIPSYNRDKLIGITLDSFINQDYPCDRYEIIVADNHSTDNTKEVVLEWQRKSTIPIRYIYEERQGVHFARNTAAKQANGVILYFTDDDMIAESDLLSELIKVFEIDPKIGTATGRVLPKWEVQPPDWILQLCYNSMLSIFDTLGEGTFVNETDFGVFSCHQAIRREVLFKLGGFNPESTCAEYIGDGETGLNIKLKDNGYKFGYNGKAVIHHMIPPARMTQDYLNKRLANQGSADCYTEYKQYKFSNEQLADRVQTYVSSLVEKSSLCVAKRLKDDIFWRMDKAYTHYYLSRIEYDLRLIKDPAWRDLVLRDDWINE